MFYNFFVTPRVEFVSRDRLERWSEACGVAMVDFTPNPGLNVYLFLLRKTTNHAAGTSPIYTPEPG